MAVDKFQDFKGGVGMSMLQVAARQFPVDRHFAHRTEEDYLAAAYKKVKTCGQLLVF